jgi:hypothetical protein
MIEPREIDKRISSLKGAKASLYLYIGYLIFEQDRKEPIGRT